MEYILRPYLTIEPYIEQVGNDVDPPPSALKSVLYTFQYVNAY